MRKKRVKVLFFSKGAKLTSEEFVLHKELKAQLRKLYDEEKTDLAMLTRNAAVPQHIEPCDYVCGQIPPLFAHIKELTLPNSAEKITTEKSVIRTVKKKETADVYQ